MTLVVTEETWAAEVLESDLPVLVDFWAPWCQPCRMVSPIVDEIGTEYAAKLKVVKLDIDDYPSIGARYGITSIPTLNVFQNGQVVQSISGAKPKPILVGLLKEFIG